MHVDPAVSVCDVGNFFFMLWSKKGLTKVRPQYWTVEQELSNTDVADYIWLNLQCPQIGMCSWPDQELEGLIQRSWLPFWVKSGPF